MAFKLVVFALFLSIARFTFAQTVELHWITVQRHGTGWQVTRVAPERDWQMPVSAGETLETIDDHPIATSSPQAMFRLLQMATTRQLQVRVISGGQTRNVKLFANSADHLPMFQRFGIGASVSDIDSRGVSMVRQVIPKGPADDAGLRTGDSITEINGEPLSGMQTSDFLAELSSTTPSPIELKVHRDNDSLSLRVFRNQTIGELMPQRVPRIPDKLFASTGNEAPAISVRGENAQLELSSLRGKWVFISFWATWCPPCIEEVPKLNLLSADRRISVWGVTLEQKQSDLQAFLQKHPLSYPIVLAGAFTDPVAQTYSVSSLPENVLINPEGNIQWLGDTVPDPAILNELMNTTR